MIEKRINSFKDYINVISEINFSSIVLFRGINDDYKLLPRIDRDEFTHFDGMKIFESFKTKSIQFLKSIPQSELDWLVLAQHYGLPTCLLDWTDSALVALWFAVKKDASIRRENSQPIVWVLMLEKNELKSIVEIRKDYNLSKNKRTEFFQPAHISNRIINQGAWLSLHPINIPKKGKTFMPLEENNSYNEKLIKLKIKFDICDEIETLLNIFGINILTIFPGLDSLSKHIIQYNKI